MQALGLARRCCSLASWTRGLLPVSVRNRPHTTAAGGGSQWLSDVHAMPVWAGPRVCSICVPQRAPHRFACAEDLYSLEVTHLLSHISY